MAQGPQYFPMYRQVRLSGWKALAAFVVLAAIIVSLVIFALGTLLVAMPFLLVASVAYRFLPRRKMRAAEAQASEPGVIEGEFRVSDPEARLIQTHTRTGRQP